MNQSTKNPTLELPTIDKPLKKTSNSIHNEALGSFINNESILASKSQFYHPTPSPETVVVHTIPKKTNDACCWGCAAALCLCFGLEECCT